ncbi:MAG: general secretion pathway protein GspB [Acidiferrobacterales bacterium]|nr:general secretion pathway protein GspB [Acidiferrobacterales bacterium]
MSNILDAIRKAEADRHNEGVPSLEAIVQQKRTANKSVGGRRSGWWIWIALCLVLASAAYLYQQPLRHYGGIFKEKLATKARVLTAQLGVPSFDSQTYPTQPLQASSAQPDVPRSGVDPTATGISERQRRLLDAVRFDVVSYSTDKVKRFAMIGNRTYREGDQLEGFTILLIRADGVVVDVSGSEVLIRP